MYRFRLAALPPELLFLVFFSFFERLCHISIYIRRASQISMLFLPIWSDKLAQGHPRPSQYVFVCDRIVFSPDDLMAAVLISECSIDAASAASSVSGTTTLWGQSIRHCIRWVCVRVMQYDNKRRGIELHRSRAQLCAMERIILSSSFQSN